MKSRAGRSQRGLLKTFQETPHPESHLCRQCPNDGCTYSHVTDELKPKLTFQSLVRHGPSLSNLVWFSDNVFALPPKYPVWLCCEYYLSHLPPQPDHQPLKNGTVSFIFFFFCLSSSELWCLARSRETGNVSSGCLNRLLPTSFSPFHFAWISANWPRTFPLSLSWPVEIRMLTKPLWEFGVIRLSHTLYECVECFSKAYTYVVAHLLFCQLDDHKLFSNPEIESQTHMVLK